MRFEETRKKYKAHRQQGQLVIYTWVALGKLRDKRHHEALDMCRTYLLRLRLHCLRAGPARQRAARHGRAAKERLLSQVSTCRPPTGVPTGLHNTCYRVSVTLRAGSSRSRPGLIVEMNSLGARNGAPRCGCLPFCHVPRPPSEHGEYQYGERAAAHPHLPRPPRSERPAGKTAGALGIDGAAPGGWGG